MYGQLGNRVNGEYIEKAGAISYHYETGNTLTSLSLCIFKQLASTLHYPERVQLVHPIPPYLHPSQMQLII